MISIAARMESNGQREKIHVSQQTADLLIEAGKHHWVTPREDKIVAKGKGELQTYWVSTKLASSAGSSSSGDRPESVSSMAAPEDHFASGSSQDLKNKMEKNKHKDSASKRLINWNVDTLQTLLKKVVAMRTELDQAAFEEVARKVERLQLDTSDGETPFEELKDGISFPREATVYKRDPATVSLDTRVTSQLCDYVATIASMYGPHSFHSFAHATHSGQSVAKLLSRIVTAKSIDYDHMSYKPECVATQHGISFGITSDPLAQFACAFTALIHDVDHPGVSNRHLVLEKADVADSYKNKCVSEQNSLDVAWTLLMEPQYRDLRASIYTTQEELNRFRNLVVSTMFATDVRDNELQAWRINRWEEAFSRDCNNVSPTSSLDGGKKALLILEHLVQASCLAHMMQHWQVYVKWNEKLFHEANKAYRAGGRSNDPSTTWYQEELEFFDSFVIPLAERLRECGVFGAAGGEYLTYALSNRTEWEAKGEIEIRNYISRAES